jgi:hypothetical protein
VDRSFTLAGAGTVVTGTVLGGTVRVGDQVRLSPSGIEARVRRIHAQNRAAESGRAGERCALNLAGTAIAKEAIMRGDMVLDPALHAPTSRLDAEITLLPGEGQAADGMDARLVSPWGGGPSAPAWCRWAMRRCGPATPGSCNWCWSARLPAPPSIASCCAIPRRAARSAGGAFSTCARRSAAARPRNGWHSFEALALADPATALTALARARAVPCGPDGLWP